MQIIICINEQKYYQNVVTSKDLQIEMSLYGQIAHICGQILKVLKANNIIIKEILFYFNSFITR